MSEEFPYIKDFPFTVLSVDGESNYASKRVRAPTPKHAVEAASITPGIDTVVGVIHGHPTVSTADDDQKQALPKRQVSDMAHAVFSAAQEGDDRIGLMAGYLDREPVTFVVVVEEDQDGSVRIAPRFVEVTDALAEEARSPDGDRLAPPQHEE